MKYPGVICAMAQPLSNRGVNFVYFRGKFSRLDRDSNQAHNILSKLTLRGSIIQVPPLVDFFYNGKFYGVDIPSVKKDNGGRYSHAMMAFESNTSIGVLRNFASAFMRFAESRGIDQKPWDKILLIFEKYRGSAKQHGRQVHQFTITHQKAILIVLGVLALSSATLYAFLKLLKQYAPKTYQKLQDFLNAFKEKFPWWKPGRKLSSDAKRYVAKEFKLSKHDALAMGKVLKKVRS
jgi:hypothetical protein